MIPEEWLRQSMKRHHAEEQARLEKLGWDKLMEEFESASRRTEGPSPGGSKWIGTGGTSPFGTAATTSGGHPRRRKGGEPLGGQGLGPARFRNLDDQVELGTRNIKVALRRLRRFARTGAAEEPRS